VGKKSGRLKALDFGALPIKIITATLGIELEAGSTSLSANAQIHASRRHPNDYSRCLPHVAQVIANPLYLGDDVKNTGKIELISRIHAIGSGLLVAVELSLDNAGYYQVVSFYPVSEAKIERRRAKGRLQNANRTV
jgi:Barnase-EndoU-ColicinE5/D-RelE like nuclease